MARVGKSTRGAFWRCWNGEGEAGQGPNRGTHGVAVQREHGRALLPQAPGSLVPGREVGRHRDRPPARTLTSLCAEPLARVLQRPAYPFRNVFRVRRPQRPRLEFQADGAGVVAIAEVCQKLLYRELAP